MSSLPTSFPAAPSDPGSSVVLLILLPNVAVFGNCYICHSNFCSLFVHYHMFWLVHHHLLVSLYLDIPQDLSMVVVQHLWRCVSLWSQIFKTWYRSSGQDSSDLVMRFHVGCYILRTAPTQLNAHHLALYTTMSLKWNHKDLNILKLLFYICFTIILFFPLLLALKWEAHIEIVDFISNLLWWCIEPKMRIVLMS